MTIIVEYRAPVLVEVDEASTRVVSVRVDDESIEGPIGTVDLSGSAVSPRSRRRAHAIAEDADWPAWSFGI